MRVRRDPLRMHCGTDVDVQLSLSRLPAPLHFKVTRGERSYHFTASAAIGRHKRGVFD
jgi:hypothetical protein